MKKLLFLPLLLLFACNNYNSNSFDDLNYGDSRNDSIGGEDGGGFQKAFAVMKTNCMGCHYHESWLTYTDEATWIDAGLVVKNDALKSMLIQRLKNYGGPMSTMPAGKNKLSDEDYLKLVNWIDDMR